MPDEVLSRPASAAVPLLTIAVPTYNRAAYLREFLEVLAPQLIALERSHPGQVELVCSDNGSSDETSTVLDEAQRLGVKMRRVRQPENIGSDRNFVACFREARGSYFWLCGDDDILRPGAVETVLEAVREADYDWIFLPPEPFHEDWRAEYKPDPYGRKAQVVRSAREMALRVNVMVTFITGMVVNRARLLQIGVESPESFIGTNLTQLSWTLPLLRNHRRSLILWQRFVAGRRMNSGGYSVGKVFGERFVNVARRLLPDRPRLAGAITNVALREWFPSTLLEMRSSDAGNRFALHEAESLLRHTFARNFRFWIFTWPIMRLPMRVAKAWCQAGSALSRVIRLLQMPADPFRKLRSRRAVRSRT